MTVEYFFLTGNKTECKYTGNILVEHHNKTLKLQKSISSTKLEKENMPMTIDRTYPIITLQWLLFMD